MLVAAPTGSGKTVVGEFAIWHALHTDGKCFYTTPIKALSNQKYNDLCELYGADRVGLLTGDNAINGGAPIVVMTTEVLRNMLYEGSPALLDLHAVVLDEVHYLADRERGGVWEEVIIQLPQDVQLACLSATVSNAEEFGAWLAKVRDGCEVVISDERPVPLEHHYAIGGRIYPMFRSGGGPGGRRTKRSSGKQAAAQARGDVPNPEVVMLERDASRRGRGRRRGPRQYHTRRLRPPRRSELVLELDHRHWLPAIVFVFSRAGCDQAVEHLMTDGVYLTSDEERSAIRATLEERTADLPDDDLAALGFDTFAAALEHGVAAHHAGMVPVLKETVEHLFVRGLVKVCFATETLALGINMPARTVAIERLEKWDGQQHTMLTSGQFTQLTGRAGRRGLDTKGHAVVLYQRDVDFPTVASLVSRRIDPLRSSFAPSYNMAVNLLRAHDRTSAEALLARSFAQFQAEAGVSDLEARIERNRTALDGYAANLHSEHGDFDDYWALRRKLSELESAHASTRRSRRKQAVEDALTDLRRGDVIELPSRERGAQLAAVVQPAASGNGKPLARAVTADRRLVRVSPQQFREPPVPVARVSLPGSGGPRQAAFRRAVASSLDDVRPRRPERPSGGNDHDRRQITHLRSKVREHPVHHDPQRGDLETWAYRYDRLAADTRKLERNVERRTGSLARAFRRIVTVLSELGYLEESAGELRPTADGLRLAGIYAETDLLLAECIRSGILSGLTGADLAAVISAFVHESRSKEPPPLRFPNETVEACWDEIEHLWSQLAAREEAAGLPPTRLPDPGVADLIWQWANGRDLDEVLATSEITGGDFVREVKQVADLLRQVVDAYAGTAVAESARPVSRKLIRGVVAFSGV